MSRSLYPSEYKAPKSEPEALDLSPVRTSVKTEVGAEISDPSGLNRTKTLKLPFRACRVRDFGFKCRIVDDGVAQVLTLETF